MKKFSLVVIVGLFSSIAMAQERSGMSFLEIGPEAYSLALSEAHTARNLGAASMFVNPAMLRLNTQNQLNLSHSIWIGDTQNSQASALFHREHDSFAVGLRTSVVDDIEARTVPGEPTGLFNVRYLAIGGAYARNLGPVALGITAMYLNEQLFEQNASGYGLHVGLALPLLNDRITLGTALTNLGEMDELAELSSQLPSEYRIGFSADLIQFSVAGTEEIPLLVVLSSDLVVPLVETTSTATSTVAQDDFYVTFGLSLEIADLLSLHGGYRTGNTTRSFSLGAGVKTGDLNFYYAFVPFETGFGTTHTIGIGYNF